MNMNNKLPTIDFSKYSMTSDKLETLFSLQTSNWVEELLRKMDKEE